MKNFHFCLHSLLFITVNASRRVFSTRRKMLKTYFIFLLVGMFAIVTAIEPRAPNFQYYERPKYRYPYYDENGVGRLLYGYGGDKLYQYKVFSPLEGIH
ncbi:unnamed protein product [Phyllotreta striolata]|uniref:Uncharacterized protein n=1 Tax=Phyllotreta striolata TaxID=444603 RepID=A0A9N9TPT1_PHYSR|nr:unnamed protein product [Phyllotreta striolata]